MWLDVVAISTVGDNMDVVDVNLLDPDDVVRDDDADDDDGTLNIVAA